MRKPNLHAMSTPDYSNPELVGEIVGEFHGQMSVHCTLLESLLNKAKNAQVSAQNCQTPSAVLSHLIVNLAQIDGALTKAIDALKEALD